MSVTGKLVRLRSAATLAIFCFVYWVVTVVALSIVSADVYDPVRQSISALALGRFGTLMNVAFFAFGVGGLALAFGLYRTVYDAAVAPLLLALDGVLWFLLGALQTGPGRAEYAAHFTTASTSFLLILVVMFLFARRFRDDARWRSFALPTLVWAIVAVAAFCLMPLLGDEVFGASERIFVAVWVSWLLATAIRLRSLA